MEYLFHCGLMDCYSFGPLVGRFGEKVIYDFGLGKNATVEQIVDSAVWKLNLWIV